MIEEQASRRRLRALRVASAAIGGAMIILGLAADRLGLGTPGSFGRGQIVFLLTGLIVFVFGLLTRVNDVQSGRSFGHRMAVLYRAAAIVLLNTLVLLMCLESGAILVLRVGNVFSGAAHPQLPDPRAELPYYTSQDWTVEYWQEFSNSRRRNYHPWVVYRRAAFNGKHININEQGIRRTPGATCTANSYKVFVLGASTVWGDGCPDWGTIPAYLQSGLEMLREEPVCVVNFGESGYVSTQNVIQLLIQIQHGNLPDLVISYEGIADSYAAYQSGQAGVHMNLDQIGARFMPGGSESPLIQWLKASYSYSLLERVVTRVKPQEQVTYQTMGLDAEDLADSVARIYLRNHELVGALSQEYGFRYLFFWQPTISVGEKRLTDDEHNIRSSMDPALVDLYDAAYRRMEQAALEYENLYYMGALFDKEPSQIWIDRHHVTPPGNQLVAEHMLDVIRIQLAGG